MDEATSRELMVNDLDDAAAFLVSHHVPMIGPDAGDLLVRILSRLEVVRKVYPLPSTVETYRMALLMAVELASRHQTTFLSHVEHLIGTADSI